MSAVYRITSFSISTSSVEPVCGLVEIATSHATQLFQLDEEMAQKLCTDLERFLTQVPQRVRHG